MLECAYVYILFLYDEFLAFAIIFIISFTSFISLINSCFLLDKSASSIISNQYSDSSASSTTIQILLKNSGFDLASPSQCYGVGALHAAR